MPTRGSYDIVNPNLHKAAQRDQSFKNCIATLFIFLFLFIIILIVGLSWKFSSPKKDDKYALTQHGSEESWKLGSSINKSREPNVSSTTGNDITHSTAKEVQATTQSSLNDKETNPTTWGTDYETSTGIIDGVTKVFKSIGDEIFVTTKATTTNTNNSNEYTPSETTMETTTHSKNIFSTDNDTTHSTAKEVQTTQSSLNDKETNPTTWSTDYETSTGIIDDVTKVFKSTGDEIFVTTQATTNMNISNEYTPNVTTLGTTTDSRIIFPPDYDRIHSTAMEVPTTTQSILNDKETNPATWSADNETSTTIRNNVTVVSRNIEEKIVLTTQAVTTNTNNSNEYTPNVTTLGTTTDSRIIFPPDYDRTHSTAMEVPTTTQSILNDKETNPATWSVDNETSTSITNNEMVVLRNIEEKIVITTQATTTNTNNSNEYAPSETSLETTTHSKIMFPTDNDTTHSTAKEVQTTQSSSNDKETNPTTWSTDYETSTGIIDDVTKVFKSTGDEIFVTTQATTNMNISNEYKPNVTTLGTTTDSRIIFPPDNDRTYSIAMEVETTTQSSLNDKEIIPSIWSVDNETSTTIRNNVTVVSRNIEDEIAFTIQAVTTNTNNSDEYTLNETTLETIIESNIIFNSSDDITHSSTKEVQATTTIIKHSNISTCNSGHCKQMAAKILSFMNHSADPCDDFYEYACGGMIAEPQIIDLNLANKAYKKITKQMRNSKDHASLLLGTYYNSCMQYGNTKEIRESIVTVNNAINEIGQFYMTPTEDWKQYSFTDLYANLLLNYSSLLFDVVPILDKDDPNSYSIKITPSSHKNLFNNEYINDVCNPSESDMQKPFIDLQNMYQTYTHCKKNTTRVLNTITEDLRMLELFNGTYSIDQNMNIEIIEGFFSKLPSENELLSAYTMEKYVTVSIRELNETTTFINWYHLIKQLLKDDVPHNKNIQVYFYKEIVNGLQHLEKYWKQSKEDFYNAILSLYAQKLYHDLVIPNYKDLEQYCLHVSTNLLKPEASYLYMSSLSDYEIAHKTSVVNKMFNELKATLKKHIIMNSVNYVLPEELLTKIDDLTLLVPKISYFQHEEDNKLNLSDKYVHNSLILMKRYRSLLYNVTSLVMKSDLQKEIWSYYATPFQSKGVVVYDLNLVIIPFGAIDFDNMIIENYLSWATIGNLIAHLISHHFDAKGICYWNQTRHIDKTLLDDFMESQGFDNYVDCQKEAYNKEKLNMTLPLTSQTISFKIPEHTLNERMSEIMGLRLTHDTLERLNLFSENPHLPWLELNSKQLFYLTYAQTYCTKSLLTTSYVNLHENEELPSRIRVFVSASTDNLLGKAWNCPKGSHIVPSSTCKVLPFQEENEDSLIMIASANKTSKTLTHTLMTGN